MSLHAVQSKQIALLGNPNTGKTTLFNALTGTYSYVGNWSGVTVEKRMGHITHGHALIDLPGLYTLNPVTRDEGVVTDFLLREQYDHITVVVDASQLNRSLQLTAQLLETGYPLTIALNMVDTAREMGISVHTEALFQQLGVPVIPINARKGTGCERLKEQLLQCSLKTVKPLELSYGPIIDTAVEQILALLPSKWALRWVALQWLENNPQVRNVIRLEMDIARLDEIAKQAEQNMIEQGVGASAYQHMHHVRTAWIEQVLLTCIHHQKTMSRSWTSMADHWFTHPVLGIPIFLLFMFLVFMFTFHWIGAPLSDGLEMIIHGPVTDGIDAVLSFVKAAPFLEAMILHGIVVGVGGILVFIPQIFVLFFFISILEDSGYMARVATTMDRLMEMIGLNGKAFIPLIIGFGCNVPGVMAARTIEQPRERVITMVLTPFMSCSARLPVYALFATAFFTSYPALVVLSLYVLGMVVAFVLAKFMSMALYRNQPSLFVMEMPPYRIPHVLTLWRSTWDKGKGFIRKAGTYILAGSVIIWLLSYTGPRGFDVEMNNSFLAIIGGWIAPLLSPLGFGNWQAAASLMTGFLAKEVVVSSMSIIYHVPEMSLSLMIAEQFTAYTAYGFMVFVLLYIPCLATVAVLRKESGSRKWTFLTIVYGIAIAYILAWLIHQVGKLLG